MLSYGKWRGWGRVMKPSDLRFRIAGRKRKQLQVSPGWSYGWCCCTNCRDVGQTLPEPSQIQLGLAHPFIYIKQTLTLISLTYQTWLNPVEKETKTENESCLLRFKACSTNYFSQMNTCGWTLGTDVSKELLFGKSEGLRTKEINLQQVKTTQQRKNILRRKLLVWWVYSIINWVSSQN